MEIRPLKEVTSERIRKLGEAILDIADKAAGIVIFSMFSINDDGSRRETIAPFKGQPEIDDNFVV